MSKELVTAEMAAAAYRGSESWFQVADRLNGALAPLLAEWDAVVRLDEAKWWERHTLHKQMRLHIKCPLCERIAALEVGRQE
jgi:hypothetical protein